MTASSNGATSSLQEEGGSTILLATQEDKDAAINMLPNPDPNTIHSCDACNKDITGHCFMRCVECKSTTEQPHEVDLCASCFAAGHEPFNHKKTHAYRVMDRLSTKIFTEDWTAAEELSLLDQVRKLGMGAWDDIADSKLFYRRKSAAEICAHYLDTYLCRFGSVLPPHYLNRRPDGSVERVPVPLSGPEPHDPRLNGVKANSIELRSQTIAELGTDPEYRYQPSWDALERKKAAMAKKCASRIGGAPTQQDDISQAADGSGGNSGAGPVGKADGTPADGTSGNARGGKGDDEGESKRGGDTGKVAQSRKRKRKAQQTSKNREEERAIKDWVSTLPGADLGGYFPLRGDFEVEHDNTAEELLANMEFRPTDHVSERQLKLDVIAVYNSRLDERERRKRFVIEHNLLDYKKQPAGTRKRLKEDRELVARLRPFARFHSAEEHDELIDNLLLAKKMRARIEQLQMYRENGITTLAEGQEFELAKRRRQEELASKKHRESASYLYDGHANGKGNSRDRNNRYSNRNKDGHAGGATDADGGEDSRSLMDLTDAPGVEYLSPAERTLCSQLHLLPGYYLVVKDAMIQECARAGCLQRKNISNLAVMDQSRLDKMYDFFTNCGWVFETPREANYSTNPSN